MSKTQAEGTQKAKFDFSGHWSSMYWRLMKVLVKNLIQRRASSMAQSLAYATILSVVPILVIFFSILGAITQDQGIRENIFEFISVYFIPQYANDIFIQFEKLARRSIALGVIGIPALLVAGVMLYTKVDDSINQIWDAEKDHKWFKNGLAFFMTLFFGPMILVLLFSIPPYIQSLPYYQEVVLHPMAQAVWATIIPFMVSASGLWVLYSYIPNVKVGAKPAMVGAAFSAALIQIANELLGFYFSNLARLDVIYGSLVTLPVLLIWVYALWMVVLTGSMLSYIVQQNHHHNYLIAENLYNDESVLCNALETLMCLARAFDAGEGPLDLDRLHFRLGLHKKRLKTIIKTLAKNEYISLVKEGKASDELLSFQLGKAARNIELSALVPLFFTTKDHLDFGPQLAALTNSLAVHPTFLKPKLNLQQLLDDPKKWVG